MKVLIAGGTGFVGRALTEHLRKRSHQTVLVARSSAGGEGSFTWDPPRGEVPDRAFEGVDAVVNLAGEPIVGARWTQARRHRIAQSRFDATQTIVDAMRRRSPRPLTLLNASAVGYYGDRGSQILDEQSIAGDGFLASLCCEWEARATQASSFGVRTVFLRFGIVLGRDGGALRKMLPAFRCGLGGRLGSGDQWMSWIGIDDTVRAIEHALTSPSLAGPINLTAPHPVTNRDFTAALARALRRPAILAVPAAVLRGAMGEMADATLLVSQRALPAKLQSAGFQFQHPELAAALGAILEP
jgi:uncharacterized protein (TIGR01777 family)